MQFTDVIGLTAGFFTTASFLPQISHVVHTKTSRDISYGMIVLFAAGIGLWLLYGIMTRSVPIIIANSVTFCLVVILFICKLKYRDRNPPHDGSL